MKKFTLLFLSVTILSLIPLSRGFAQMVSLSPAKKLIDFGWNSPRTNELRDNLQKYEKEPFDGITVKLPEKVGGGKVFMVKDLLKISEKDVEAERSMLERMSASKVLTDNFIVIYVGSQLDWFSDEDWKVADTYIRYAA